ncbi:hypothetical protein CDV31_003250 [Fusarium ambrosium]|uniref:Uncharacterized protein n=1 Tax=Fusarium ambrosium TaxID=131363 RepID=A0A428UU67_9HYPO|nr:hypothetical protein CDV31_003250 [Fusarium ambrosium]
MSDEPNVRIAIDMSFPVLYQAGSDQHLIPYPSFPRQHIVFFSLTNFPRDLSRPTKPLFPISSQTTCLRYPLSEISPVQPAKAKNRACSATNGCTHGMNSLRIGCDVGLGNWLVIPDP